MRDNAEERSVEEDEEEDVLGSDLVSFKVVSNFRMSSTET